MSLLINRFNLFLPRWVMPILFLWLLLTVMMPSYATQGDISEQEATLFDQLADLSLEELGEVEVTLSDVFDIFDALVYTKEVKLATGTWQSTARAPSVTTVITAQDIEATGATDLDEVLEMVPGLHVSRSRVYSPYYTIRGIYSFGNPQVLVLINGIPIKRLFQGNRGWMWGGMPVAAIARIEVIRGPGSAVYGADAFAGVINVITKTKEDIEGSEMGGRVGHFETADVWALHGENYGGFDVATTIEYYTTEGHQEIIDADGQTSFDGIFGTHASLAPGPVNLQRRNLDARLDVSKENWRLRSGYQGQYDNGTGAGSASLDPLGRYSDYRFNTDLTYHNQEVTDNWDVTAQLSYYHTKYETHRQTPFPPGAFGGAYPEGLRADSSVSESHTRLDLSGFYIGFNKHMIRLGTGYYYGDHYKLVYVANTDPTTGGPIPPEEGLRDFSDTPYAPNPEGDRKNWYLFLQDIWAFTPNWELTSGIRYDKYSDFGSTLNPRMALVWQPRVDFTAKLLYGSAFRAPTFLELYASNNPFTLGNPALKPETIKTWELAFNYRATNNLHFTTNLFTYKWTDGIRYLPGSSQGIFVAKNAGIQKAHGLELEARWKMTKKSSLLANYAFVKATDENNNHDAGNYPQHSAYLRTDWLVYPNWYLNAQINWVGERKRVFGDPRPSLEGYTTVDLTLRRKDIREGEWNLAMSVRNLFDTNARGPSVGPDPNGVIFFPNDLPLAGRHYWLELRYRF